MRTNDHPTNAPRSPAPSGVAGHHLTRAAASHGSVGATVAKRDATSTESSQGT